MQAADSRFRRRKASLTIQMPTIERTECRPDFDWMAPAISQAHVKKTVLADFTNNPLILYVGELLHSVFIWLSTKI
jgi:hypothetical protein